MWVILVVIAGVAVAVGFVVMVFSVPAELRRRYGAVRWPAAAALGTFVASAIAIFGMVTGPGTASEKWAHAFIWLGGVASMEFTLGAGVRWEAKHSPEDMERRSWKALSPAGKRVLLITIAVGLAWAIVGTLLVR